MKIYKFGGASVKDSEGVRNVASIISQCHDPLIVVVSAMGKTTNALEELLNAYFDNDKSKQGYCFQDVVLKHQDIIHDLFGSDSTWQPTFDAIYDELWRRIEKAPSLNYDFEYDQIVSFGELISTAIVSAYLNQSGISNQWVDIRPILKTDDNYREPAVNWDLTSTYVKKQFSFNNTQCYLTQGFIGSTTNNLTTTLGREGSDYTAAILAHILDAEYVAIWKDVPGVLNADPRWYPNTVKLPEISYWEAIELTYHGAQVIHPKTLKPLQNKGIPLWVKSFMDPKLEGTVIKNVEKEEINVPVLILKTDQLFLTISPRDFSFIVEDNLSDIFAVFSKHKVKMNLMQKSALNFSVCTDKKRGLDLLLSELEQRYVVRYNDSVELLTIRHYSQSIINELTRGKEVIDSQITRKSARFVMKKSPWTF
jgi:aspartate kinase